MIRSSARGLTARPWWNARRFCIGIASGAAGLLLVHASVFGRSMSLPTLAAQVHALQPFYASAPALPVLVKLTAPGFSRQALSHDCSAGMDFLPTGDLVCLDSATRLFSFDVNGDGAPVGEHTIATLSPSGVFGAFVKVTPDGMRVLVAESSFGRIFIVNLATGAVQYLTTLTQPFDVTLLSDTEAIVSANPSGTGTTLYHLNLSTGALHPVANISGPSGPVALDAAGNLYYGRSTFEFPAPPHSHTLLRFRHADVAQAVNGTRILAETDAQEIARLDSGFDLVLNTSGDIFVTNLFGIVYRVTWQGLVSTFAQTTGGFALFTYAALYQPASPFHAFQESPSRLAFFVDDLAGHRQVIVVRPRRRS